MEDGKNIGRVVNEEYLKIVPRIAYYLKSKNNRVIFKYKSLSFAAAGYEGGIYLFSNSLEHMGTFSGHKHSIGCLCRISHKILASGSMDKNIKIWDIEERSLISTLSQHTDRISTLCCIKEGVLVSGSVDKSLIIWSKLPGSSPTYSHRDVLTGHTSGIYGIISINNREIISGEWHGHLRMWDIDQGVCIRHLPSIGRWGLRQMKQHIWGEVVISYREEVIILGAANNWENSLRQVEISAGCSIEFLDEDLLLVGGRFGQLEFIDYAQIGCSLPPSIQRIHFKSIKAIQRIAKNIVVTVSHDGYLKVIDPISRTCYLTFTKDKGLYSLTNFY